MTTTTDDLRQALGERASAISLPATPPVRLVRQRVLVDRLRTATTVLAALVLVSGVAVALRDPSSSPSTVDSRLGGLPGVGSTTTTVTAAVVDPGAGGAGAPKGGGAPAAAPAQGTTTTTLPGSVGPLQISNSPPTTRGPGGPTFAVAQPGSWYYKAKGEMEPGRSNVLGGNDTGVYPETSFKVYAANGRTQRTTNSSAGDVTFRGAIRTLSEAVTLHQVTLWGTNREDTERVFKLPPGAFEVPAEADWGRAWSYEATSTEGSTRLRVQSRVAGWEYGHVGESQYESVKAVRVESVIDVSGDRTAHIERTVYWEPNLGVPAEIHEVETTTTSKGERYHRDVTIWLLQSTPGPYSVNNQVAPDDDENGVPDSADQPDP